MIALGAADTFRGNAGTGAVITYTLSGMELSAGVETYKTLAQGQLSTGGPAILYTVPASTSALIKTIHLANTSGSDVTSVKVFVGGGAATNQLTSLTIPANGEATFDGSGWKVYDAAGSLRQTVVLTSMAQGTVKGRAAGAGTGDPADLTGTQVSALLDAATTSAQGAMSAFDKAFVAAEQGTRVNVLRNAYSNLTCDGSTDDLAALNALLAAVPDKSTLVWPPGTMRLSNAPTVPAGKHLAIVGGGQEKTYWLQSHPTADHIAPNDWQWTFDGITFSTGTTSIAAGSNAAVLPQATINIAGLPTGAPAAGTVTIQSSTGWQTITYTGSTPTTLTGCTGGAGTLSTGGKVYFKTGGYAINSGALVQHFIRNCRFVGCFNGWLNNGTLCDIKDSQFADTINFSMQFNGSNVNASIRNVTADGSPAAVAHIEVNQCGSLIISDCDLIRATNNLRVNTTGYPVGAFGIYGSNTFFDTAAGSSVKFMGTGAAQRCKFVNCWMSSSVNGIEFASTASTLPTAIDLVDCDIYSNSGSGILVTGTGVAEWAVYNSRIAGNGTGITLVAGATHSATIMGNRIGATGGIGNNTTGINVGAGAYAGLTITNNDMGAGNGTNITLGAVTVTTASRYRITDNPGYNPLTGAAVTTPAVPAAGVTATNTTGRRVIVSWKSGITAPAAVVVNGVSSTNNIGAASAAGPTIPLEPGGTIAFTTTTAASWTWIGQ